MSDQITHIVEFSESIQTLAAINDTIFLIAGQTTIALFNLTSQSILGKYNLSNV